MNTDLISSYLINYWLEVSNIIWIFHMLFLLNKFSNPKHIKVHLLSQNKYIFYNLINKK